jgi:hypothetical protein
MIGLPTVIQIRLLSTYRYKDIKIVTYLIYASLNKLTNVAIKWCYKGHYHRLILKNRIIIILVMCMHLFTSSGFYL